MLTVTGVQILAVVGMVLLDVLAWVILRYCGYFHPILCHRCGKVHVPPWYYRGAHSPQRDWDTLAQQCRAINPRR
jgi:hypothetical protein